MTGSGGWPLNVVTLHDGRPIWGGTYFKKEEWIQSLEQLQEFYQSSLEKMINYAEKLHQGIQVTLLIQKEDPETEVNQNILKLLVEKWEKSFDLEFGGMIRAPKFMMPNN